MQKIIPNLWFDTNAEEAVNFYASLFANSKIGKVSRYGKEGHEIHKMEEGTVMTIDFELEGYKFLALNGGPIFKFNPSISFLVVCNTKEEVDRLWDKLSKGGKVLMELGEYPYSKRYGWCQDRFGLSWQIMLGDEHYKFKHNITPTLMFVGEVCGRAEEAMNFYVSIFQESKVGGIAKYPTGMAPDKEGTVMHGSFTIANQEFFTMDSARMHDFKFNEAISLIVNCKDQKEIDYFWNKLSADPKSEVCGWLKDKFGVSWQIVPEEMGKLISGSKEQSGRVMNAFLEMKKIDVATLKKAYNG